MLRLILFSLSLVILSVSGEKDKDVRKIHLEGLGTIVGEKFWDGEFYEYFGVPYATAPKGRDKFKAPLPPTPWEKERIAKDGLVFCQQVYRSSYDDEGDLLYGLEECLTATLMVPKIASKTNLVPIIVYIHSGGYAGGSGNMAKFHHLARQDVLVVNFNYRVGAIGFACLGTEDIPGNAALKDIVAALKFIKKYAKTLGGDPDNITLAGYSIGASLAEIVALSKETRGLFSKLALDSGSAISPFAVNRHPIETAKNIAKSVGYKGTGNIEDLNEFYLEADVETILSNSRHFFLKNSTFGFTPCIENPTNPGAVLTESPLDILKKGDYGDFALLTGFANMEGISRTSMFDEWRGLMNEKFEDFLPADIVFENNKERDEFIKEIKKYYFDSKPLTVDSLQGFIDYFSDSMFKYSIVKSTKLHAENLKRSIFMYEFTYVGKLNTQHAYMDKIRGASHRDASAYVLDFFDWTRNYTDMDMRDILTTMWGDFVKFENPTAYESSLLTVKWLKYTNKEPNYLDIGDKLEMKKNPFSRGYQIWDKVYKTQYWTPTVVNPEAYKGKPKLNKIDETKPIENKQANVILENPKVNPSIAKKTIPNNDEKPVPKSYPDPKARDSKVKETVQKPVEIKANVKNAGNPPVATEAKNTEQKPVVTKLNAGNSATKEAKTAEQKPVETNTNTKTTRNPSINEAKTKEQKPGVTKTNAEAGATNKAKKSEQKPVVTTPNTKKPQNVAADANKAEQKPVEIKPTAKNTEKSATPKAEQGNKNDLKK